MAYYYVRFAVFLVLWLAIATISLVKAHSKQSTVSSVQGEGWRRKRWGKMWWRSCLRRSFGACVLAVVLFCGLHFGANIVVFWWAENHGLALENVTESFPVLLAADGSFVFEVTTTNEEGREEKPDYIFAFRKGGRVRVRRFSSELVTIVEERRVDAVYEYFAARSYVGALAKFFRPSGTVARRVRVPLGSVRKLARTKPYEE